MFRTRHKTRPTKRIQKARHCEALEARIVFDSDGAWSDAAALTLSFAPDGALIGSHANALQATMDGLGAQSWQDVILEAFQTWAQYVNINVGVVDDLGVPFGTPTDATIRRFGDIRIGAIPMSPETLAVSVPNDETSGGSWSGDVLFNSLGDFTDLETLYKVALHEAGHVLGLEHNLDPLSPMFKHAADIEAVPTTADVDDLMALYGERGPDRNELKSTNNTIDTATLMGLSDDDSHYAGSTPAIGFGAITSASDVDVFELPNVSDYSGPIRFTLQTRGLSLLQAKLTIVDESNAVIGQAEGVGHTGDTLSVTVPATSNSIYYARVQANTSDLFGLGGYAIVGSFVDRQTAMEAEIARVIDQSFHLVGYDESAIDDLDIRDFLSDDEFDILKDDAHTDDDDAEAVELKAAVNSVDLLRYRAVATISVASDHDVYRVYSAERSRLTQVMTVAVESLSPDGLIPRILVRDRHGLMLPAQVVANGAGLYVLQIANIESDRQFFVEVSSASQDPQFAVGNYKLAISFTGPVAARETLFAGTLSTATPVEVHALYVAKTQLFSLLFSTTAGSSGGSAWMAIYDQAERPLFYLAAPIGELRSATSLLLDPGEYLVEFGSVEATSDSVTFSLQSETISHPIGPPVVDTATTPIYACAGTPNSYCYPGDVVSASPVNIAATTTTPAFGLIRPAYTPPADAWYWSANQLSTNALLPGDTNGDGRITPLDVLLIINDLNAFGSRQVARPPIREGVFLDVNHDGVITPLDALLIINYLNTGSAAGEPTGTASTTALPERTASEYFYWLVLTDQSKSPR